MKLEGDGEEDEDVDVRLFLVNHHLFPQSHGPGQGAQLFVKRKNHLLKLFTPQVGEAKRMKWTPSSRRRQSILIPQVDLA